MKTCIVALTALLLSFFSLQSQLPDTLLVAYWSFNDSTAKDHSGNNYHGTFMGKPKPVEGVKGAGMRFVGSLSPDDGDYMLLPMINFSALGEFTISFWVNEEEMIDEGWGGGEAYVNWGNHSTGWIGIMNHYMQVPFYDSKLYLQASVGANYTSSNYNLYYKYNMNDRFKWIFYCMSFKDDTLYLFKGNDLLGKKYQKLNIKENFGAVARHWWDYCGLSKSSRLTASFDEIKIFRKALIPDDINEVKDSCGSWSIEYNDFSDTKGISLLGSAVEINNFIRLTSTKYNRVGAFWVKNKLPLNDGFKLKVKFKFSEGFNGEPGDNSYPGADGIAIVFQNSDINQIGAFGGGIGYEGINNALALELDTYSNDSNQITDYHDPNGNHFAIQTSSTGPLLADHGDNTLFINKDISFNFSDGTDYDLEIDYNNELKLLSAFLSTKSNRIQICKIPGFVLKDFISLDESNFGYLGITSATGNAYENHDILSMSFCSYSKLDFVSNVNIINSNSGLNEVLVYPNPTDDVFNIKVNESNIKEFSLKIFNSLGIEVYRLQGNSIEAGKNIITWDALNNKEGIYFYEIMLGQIIYSGKLLFIK